jgi:hypothetical protein
MFIPDNAFGPDKVNHSDKPVFRTDGDLYDQGMGSKTLSHHLHRPKEIRPNPIHLVDEGHLGNPIFICLVPYGLGLGFHAFDGAEDRNGPIQHTQRTFHFNREIDMTGSINNMNGVPLPFDRRDGRGNGNSSFLFLLHPIHGGRAIIYFSHAVGLFRVKKDPFSDSGLSRIDVGHKPNISGSGEPFLSSHLSSQYLDKNISWQY